MHRYSKWQHKAPLLRTLARCSKFFSLHALNRFNFIWLSGYPGQIRVMRPNSSVSLLEQPFRTSSSIPLAFRIAAKSPEAPEREVRLACRDLFRSGKLLGRIIPLIDDVLAAGGIQPPEAPPESVPPAIPNPESDGDVGHRSR